MKAVTQFVIRQSGWLTSCLLWFALLNGAYVCEGLWQGSGLHGYILDHGAKGGPPHVVSTGAAFVQMLTFAGLAGVLLGIRRWHLRKNPTHQERLTVVFPHRRRAPKMYHPPGSRRRG